MQAKTKNKQQNERKMVKNMQKSHYNFDNLNVVNLNEENKEKNHE